MPIKLTPEQFVDAIGILKTARVGLHSRTGPIQWLDRDQMMAALDLYAAHNHRMDIGCAHCHTEVFNWLLDQVMADVTTQAMDPNAPTSVHFANQ